MWVRYRGVKVACSVTSLGRVVVETPDGVRIGSSGYGAV